MNDTLNIILLAILQGITEFLPISSSGHLVLAEHLLKMKTTNATLEIFLHTGTLISLVVFYFHRLLGLATGALRRDRPTWRFLLLMGVAILPAVVVYFLTAKIFGMPIDEMEFFKNPRVVSALLCVTGVVLLLPELLRRGSVCTLTWVRALLVGLAQAAALLPGLSRSGTTISMARVCRVDPVQAAEFSFLIALPLLAAATAKEGLKLVTSSDVSIGISTSSLGIGIAVSAVVGYVALTLLVRMLQRQKFWIFGIYCLVLGTTALILL